MLSPRLGRSAVAFVSLVMLTWVAVLVPVAFAGSAPMFGLQQALYADPPQADSHFGRSVAISGDTIVVGEPDRLVPVPGTTGIRCGAASVYVRSAGKWTLQTVLLPTSLHAGDMFGAAVAIDGNLIVVGAPKHSVAGSSTGSAFVYSRTGSVWSAGTEIAGASISDDAEYGSAVAVDSDTIVVGALRDDDVEGSASVFRWTGTTWLWQMTLKDPAPRPGDQFGGSVAIAAAVAGDTIFVGSTGDTYQPGGAPMVMSAGSVHVFQRGMAVPWVHSQTLFAPVPQAAEQFGGPIAASGGRMLAAAWEPMGPGGTIGAGVVYAFAESGGVWSYETSLSAPVPEPAGYYGSGVGLDGDTAVVGAFFSNGYRGRAFFYSHASGSWQLVQQVDMAGHTPGVVQLGTSAGLSGDTAVLGAQMAFAPTVATPGAGGAYVFKSPANLWGMVTDAATGLPVSGIEVSAYTPDAFGDPELAGITYSDPSGLYALSLPAGGYRLGWMDGTDTYYAGFYNEAATFSSATTLTVTDTPSTRIDLAIHAKPKAYLTKPTSLTSVSRYSRFRAWGYLKPRHRAGTYPVKIQCYRYQRLPGGGSGWVLRRTYSAKAYDYRPRLSVRYYTKYVGMLRLPYAGRWRIRAYHPGDAVYTATYTGYRYIRVR